MPEIPFAVSAQQWTMLAAFTAVVSLVWLLLDRLTTGDSKAVERLQRMSRPERSHVGREAESGDRFSRMLEKAAPALAKPLQSKDEKEISRLRQRLVQAGYRDEFAPTAFLSIKVLGLAVGLIVGGGSSWLLGYSNSRILYQSVIAAGVMFYLPELVLSWLISRRQKAIFLGLPDALDLLVVCVEAGLGLDQAMRKVGEEMVRTHPVIAEEFSLCNFQLQVGRPRSEVLQDLGNRTGVEDVRALSTILIQADKFGSSIAQALRVQSDSMRTRRRQLAEEKAAKTAVKLIFPLVLFIFPGIFVVLVGPAAITMMREMFPAMRGG
ncbi:MAG: secretion protein [Pirellulaceae bacterium]|nr:MAG: secretion protein [Pirellulaceae bacterium]